MLAYKITNAVNGKAYVGITSRPVAARWRQHLQAAMGGTRTALYRAMRKHGPENFSVEAIGCARDWQDLCALERHLIAEHGTFVAWGGGYNQTLGGEGSLGYRMSEAFKKAQARRMSERQARRMADPSIRAAAADALRAIHRDPEVSAVMRERQREAMRDPALRERARLKALEQMSDPTARELVAMRTAEAMACPERRARLSAIKRELHADPAYRAALSERQRSLWDDPERRAKMASRREVVVHGVRYRGTSAAGKALGLAPATIRARADRGAPGYAWASPPVRPAASGVIAEGRRFPTVSAASRALGVAHSTLRHRIACGFPGYAVVREDGGEEGRERRADARSRAVIADGRRFASAREAASALGITACTLSRRIAKGVPGYAYADGGKPRATGQAGTR